MTAGAGHRLLVIAGSQLRHEDADGPADPAAGRHDLRGADRRAPGPGRHSAHGRGWGAPLWPPEAPSSLTSALVTAAVSVLCIPAGRSPRTLRCWVSVASSSGPSLVLASLLLPVSLLSPTPCRKQAKKKKKKTTQPHRLWSLCTGWPREEAGGNFAEHQHARRLLFREPHGGFAFPPC